MKKKPSKFQLQLELERYVSEGMLLWLNGKQSNPEQIVKACLIEEENNYMRDYIPDEEGGLKGLAFDKVKIK
jgi:hypothetical protein